ncbi:MAG: RDD family protein [Gemmatimonadota bacterium]
MAAAERTHAGLRLRSFAFALDYVLIAIYLVVLVVAGGILSRTLPSIARSLFDNPIWGQATGFIVVTLPVTLYFTLLEASSWQASWGKRKMHLVVTDMDGERISLTRSLSRTVLKFIPWELAHLCIWQVSFALDKTSPIFTAGFALVWLLVAIYIMSMLISPTRQTVYDRLAGAFVLKQGCDRR